MTGDDTIFAPSSGAGPAAVAVIRISGPAAGAALVRLAGRVPPARRMTRVRVADADGGPIDDALAVWFPAPASATGEDVAELHVHGGRAVVAAALAALGACAGLRPAEPGEFARRAFDNGKLDLTAAEGLADLVAAETEAQRRQALRQAEGALGALYEDWRARLIGVLGHLEAALDFADEDVPSDLEDRAGTAVAALSAEVARHLDDGRRGERLRDGVHIAIVGPPNAGKSMLLNRLARRDAAIVSATAGTTRDVVEVHLDLGGYPVVVADTAGLRDGSDEIEREGVRRALARVEAADLRLAVFDGALWPAIDPATAAVVDEQTLVVVNKGDLGTVPAEPDVAGRSGLRLSALTGDGVDDLVAAIAARVEAALAGGAQAPALTRARHRAALEDCAAALRRAATAEAPELVAEEVRLAVRALGRITGRVDVEDVLDAIFAEFCIGK